MHLLPLTWSMTLLINALTDGVKISLVLWKHHKTIPPLLNMVNKSNILQPPTLSLNSCWSDNYSRKYVNTQSRAACNPWSRHNLGLAKHRLFGPGNLISNSWRSIVLQVSPWIRGDMPIPYSLTLFVCAHKVTPWVCGSR